MSVGFDHFEQSFIAGQYECDRNGRMKAGAIMSQCQSISTNHCNEVGLTIDVYRKPTVCSCWQGFPWSCTGTFGWGIASGC